MSGSPPFALSLKVNSQQANVLTHEFLLTMINYASQYAEGLSSKASSLAMWASFSQLNPYVQSYLTEGCRQAKDQMYSNSLQREEALERTVKGWQESEAVMVSMAFLYTLGYLLLIFGVIHRINGERVNIF
jgi:hypothetical protein